MRVRCWQAVSCHNNIYVVGLIKLHNSWFRGLLFLKIIQFIRSFTDRPGSSFPCYRRQNIVYLSFVSVFFINLFLVAIGTYKTKIWNASVKTFVMEFLLTSCEQIHS